MLGCIISRLSHNPYLQKSRVLRLQWDLQGAASFMCRRFLWLGLKTIAVGCSGGPALLTGPHQEDPRYDLLVGVVSSANYSGLHQSGIGCVLVGSVLEWVRSIVDQVWQVPGSYGWEMASHGSPLNTTDSPEKGLVAHEIAPILFIEFLKCTLVMWTSAQSSIWLVEIIRHQDATPLMTIIGFPEQLIEISDIEILTLLT